MPKTTITFDPQRLAEAMAEEMNHHWRTLSGHCECHRSVTKDPAKMRAHIADEMLAVVLRFQEGSRPLSPGLAKVKAMLDEASPSLRTQERLIRHAGRTPEAIVVPAHWPQEADGAEFMRLRLMREAGVDEPTVVSLHTMPVTDYRCRSCCSTQEACVAGGTRCCMDCLEQGGRIHNVQTRPRRGMFV